MNAHLPKGDAVPCLVCPTGTVELLPTFSRLPRVTSDCKPWPSGGAMGCCSSCGAIQKVADPKWFDEISRIYEVYQIYYQSAGKEQLIFSPQAVAPRSEMLARFVVKHLSLPAGGSMIDIGCGNGAALANFGSLLPDWRLFGSELSERNLPRLRDIAGFERLYTCPTGEIQGQYDLVSMIHSLEHMPQPGQTLREACGLVAPGGRLFIQVPDVETSPFDLLVADHLVHFTRDTLACLAAGCGLAVDFLSNTVLTKEITLLARAGGPGEFTQPQPQRGRSIAEAALTWLEAVLERAEQLAGDGKFGIFGTSISGNWLFGHLRGRVDFFVDEDPSRVGQTLDGVPILSPDQVEREATVYVPLVPNIAASVIERLGGHGFRIVAPPEQMRAEVRGRSP